MTDTKIAELLAENDRRNEIMFAKFDPVTGEGSIGKRVRVSIADFAIPVQWLPVEMMKIPFVKKLVKAGSIDKFLSSVLHVEPNEDDHIKVSRTLIRLRFKHDFPFWTATLVYIHNKDAGKDVLFRLWYPQRILVSRFEAKRKAGKPIRLILLKARQWGGSTTVQLYMAWLQFFHKKGLNSLIIAHQGTASDEIKDMFDLMIKKHPVEFLHKLGEVYSENEPKLVGVGKSGSTYRVPQRDCKIKVGTAERPNGCRGGAYSLVHLSEVGLWKKTDGKSPEDIVRSACSGILARPYTMIVMESTADGVGTYFDAEYTAAADPTVKSQFEALFISWFQIEHYSRPFDSAEELRAFAKWLWENRNNAYTPSNREESGRYLWSLWEKGATLEAIHWYIYERAGKNDFAVMAAEFPSDDVEAFVHAGTMVFDKYLVKQFEPYCRKPKFVGEVYADADAGEEALSNLRFREDRQGLLSIWAMPEKFDDYEVTDRYLTVVDVGGRSNKADWSVIVVFDRLSMIDGSEPPSVVAQWYGHCDIDRLAWRAAQIAAFYNDSLLVIESNTLETHDKERQVEGGDQSQYILNQISDIYPNLYARKQSEDEIREGAPRKYGFHTNVATKPMIISTLVKVIRERLYIERDKRCLDEYDTYERKPNGAYGAIVGKHDDLLMTRAIGLHICYREMEMPEFVPITNRTLRKDRSPVSEASI
ncbi:MAG: terminase [Prevotella sp.]|nr:terminase [Prevotella sp.]